MGFNSGFKGLKHSGSNVYHLNLEFIKLRGRTIYCIWEVAVILTVGRDCVVAQAFNHLVFILEIQCVPWEEGLEPV